MNAIACTTIARVARLKAAASVATLVCSRCHEHKCARQLQSRRAVSSVVPDQQLLASTRSAGAYAARKDTTARTDSAVSKTAKVLGLGCSMAHRALYPSFDRFLEAQRQNALPKKPDLTQALSFLNCRPSNAAAPGPLLKPSLLRCLRTVCSTPCDFRVERRRRRGVTALSARARRRPKTRR